MQPRSESKRDKCQEGVQNKEEIDRHVVEVHVENIDRQISVQSRPEFQYEAKKLRRRQTVYDYRADEKCSDNPSPTLSFEGQPVARQGDGAQIYVE